MGQLLGVQVRVVPGKYRGESLERVFYDESPFSTHEHKSESPFRVTELAHGGDTKNPFEIDQSQGSPLHPFFLERHARKRLSLKPQAARCNPSC